jgi:tripartite-type tricarboxylate transporter receptor subunit TctC
MKTRRAVLAMSLCALGALHDVAVVRAQSPNYPSRPIKMIVPFPAGGPTDGMARLISDRLGAVLGQSVITENHGGGAGGSVGAKLVAAAEPDGYTILITPGGSLTTGPAVHKNIGYDPARSFTPVALLTIMPTIISVNAALPVRSLSELVTYAKTNPGKISWGSQGFGTSTHLLAELFKLETRANIVHVPYRGSAPLLAAIIAGEVQMMADPSITSLPSIQAGKLRPLAIAGPERSAKLPDVPTTTEAGFPKLQSPFWLGAVAPAGTPPGIIDRLNAALRAAFADPQTRTRLDNLGAEIRIGTPAEFGTLLAQELAQWTAVCEGRQHHGGISVVHFLRA